MADKNKKGLVIIYDPHSLQQFVWYYCANGLNKEWDALCLPNGYKGCYMHSYCDKAGLFSSVFKGDVDYLHLPNLEKAKIFAKMFLYFIIGKRRKYCKMILNEYVDNIDDYDELVAICDTGFVSGACVALGNEKRVVLLDDGGGEYVPRSRWKSCYKTFSPTYWQAFFLSKMGYCCKGRFYFAPTKNCYKYSAAPDKMQYTNYKEMLPLLDMKGVDERLYHSILKKIYPCIEEMDFDSVEAVLFTGNITDFFSDCQDYYKACTSYIGEHYKTVLIKRHPRDSQAYVFAEDVKVLEANNEVPAEVLLPYLKDKKIFFFYPSSVILFMQPYGYRAYIIYSQKMYGQQVREEGCVNKLDSRDKYEKVCQCYAGDNYEIVEV